LDHPEVAATKVQSSDREARDSQSAAASSNNQQSAAATLNYQSGFANTVLSDILEKSKSNPLFSDKIRQIAKEGKHMRQHG